MGYHDLANHGQAMSRARRAGGKPGLENPASMVGSDTIALISNPEDEAFMGAFLQRNPDRPSILGRLLRIRKQILNHTTPRWRIEHPRSNGLNLGRQPPLKQLRPGVDFLP